MRIFSDGGGDGSAQGSMIWTKKHGIIICTIAQSCMQC